MLPQYCSPYNTEKRRLNEEQAIAAAEKPTAAAAAAAVAMPPAYRDMELILFPEGSLKDSNGNIVSQQHLIGKSVGLYFADSSNPKCNSFLPFLLQIERDASVPTLGQGPRACVPALVVVGADGRDAQFLQVGGGRDEGERAILRWDWRNTKFGADRFLVRRDG
ncbi:PDI-like protein-related, related [Eimeria mitis]|uniref:PDI-like protein-related, related n=1 Tax=Eimeria mitis TaxID=44415 RepID=U6KDI7_9EIME|nr:PDI-like protein-related, related [Eimeria mitis]CDJ34317.1 PDI-like protein-related, related [Eimeria mitis]